MAFATVFLLAACATPLPEKPAFRQAQERMQQGDWTGARRLLEKAVQQQPEHLDARYNLALLLARNGHRADAAALYRQNLAIAPHLPSAINLAVYLYKSGQHERARRILQQAATAFPHEAVPWYMLGLIAWRQQQIEAAEHAFASALQADRSNGFAHLYYARFLADQNNMQQALPHAEKAIALLPDCAACWRIYGDILASAKQQSRAMAAYQRSLAIEPDTLTRERLIALLEQSGEHERAQRMKRALQAWKRQHPDHTSPIPELLP